jgi:hypothetical protein
MTSTPIPQAFVLFLPRPERTLHATPHPADDAWRQTLFEPLDVLQRHTRSAFA